MTMRATRAALLAHSSKANPNDVRESPAWAEVAMFERIAEALEQCPCLHDLAPVECRKDGSLKRGDWCPRCAALADLDRLRGQTEGDHHAGHSAHPGETVPVASSACPRDGGEG